MKRLQRRLKHAQHRWIVHCAVRRADAFLARSRPRPSPGYDELAEPAFVIVMTLAVIALVCDLSVDVQQVASWLNAAGELLGGQR